MWNTTEQMWLENFYSSLISPKEDLTSNPPVKQSVEQHQTGGGGQGIEPTNILSWLNVNKWPLTPGWVQSDHGSIQKRPQTSTEPQRWKNYRL